MSMVSSAYPAGGGVALPLFRVRGAELPGSIGLFDGTRGSGGIELREEAGLDWWLGSTPVTSRRLAGGVLASERRVQWRHATSGLSLLEAIFFTLLGAGGGAGPLSPSWPACGGAGQDQALGLEDPLQAIPP